jgi:protein-tyrosine phosphatase
MAVWDGAFNLRDLGGLPLQGGGMTTHGGRPETLTDAGWADLRRAGVGTVIDLRNESERQRRDTDPALADGYAEGILFASTPTEDPDDPDFMQVLGPWLDHPRGYADNIRMYPEKLAAVFATIADARTPVLVHCAAGRDRTGMVTAMLLRLTGVETDAIVDDYAAAFREATRRARDLPAAPDPNQGGYIEPPYSDDEIEERIATRVIDLREWIEPLDVRTYLSRAGVSSAQLEALTARLRG